jgi:hypothetical protein
MDGTSKEFGKRHHTRNRSQVDSCATEIRVDPRITADGDHKVPGLDGFIDRLIETIDSADKREHPVDVDGDLAVPPLRQGLVLTVQELVTGGNLPSGNALGDRGCREPKNDETAED